MERAFGYCRVSTDEQAQPGHVSLDDQRGRIERLCEERGYQLVELFTDVGSGRSDRRPQYQRMLTTCAGRADVVVSYALDRFGRNMDEISWQVLSLKRAGVRVECTDDPMDPQTLLGRFLRSVKGFVAEMESDDISRRVRSALAFRFEQGGHIGRIPYGWDYHERKFSVNLAEARVVRLMAALLLEENLSLRRIAWRLNEEGYRRRDGKPWLPSSVGKVLKREWNHGQKTYKAGGEGGQEISVPVPPILERDGYALILDRLKQHGKPRGAISGRASGSAYLLAGLLRCGHCGWTMIGAATTSARARQPSLFYHCRGHRDARTCPTIRYQNAGRLEAAVLEALAPVADSVLARASMPKPEAEPDRGIELAEVESSIRSVDQELSLQVGLCTRGVITERELSVVASGLRDRRAALEARLGALEREVAGADERRRRLEQIPMLVRTFTEDGAKLPLPARKARLRELVEQITVWSDGRLEIRLHFSE